MIRLQTIVYTTHMEASEAWYSVVLGSGPAHSSPVWTSFDVGDCVLALHGVDESPLGSGGELSLVSDEPLEDLIARLERSGVAVRRGIRQENFGRSLVLEDPNGLLIQVNEHE
ncbi:MAG: hypothetical protein L0Z63_03740 [Actinobacteria bacterium]|nr:hypothetical protein [Actinomycetota bacterium]